MVKIGNAQVNKGADITAASNITIPDGNYFIVNGTTAITSITAGVVGKIATLEFANDQAKVRDGSNIRLAANQDFFATGTGGSSTLTLISDGTNWNELARSPQSVKTRTGFFQRTAASGTGSQSITGIGYLPKALMLLSARNTIEVSTTVVSAEAIGGAANVGGSYVFTAGQNFSITNGQAVFLADGTNQHSAGFTSFDDDGFTINWNTATGGGTSTVRWIAFI
jgi:hypothetical protein